MSSHPYHQNRDPRYSPSHNKRRRNDSSGTSNSPYSDGSDVECSRKDGELRRLRGKLTRFAAMTEDNIKRMKELEANIKEKDDMVKNLNNVVKEKEDYLQLATLDFDKKAKGIENYKVQMQAQVKAQENAKNQALKENEELKRQLNNKRTVDGMMEKSHQDKLKGLQSTVKQLTTEKALLTKKLNEKDTKLEENGQNMNLIERLENEVQEKKITAKKYKDKYEQCRNDLIEETKMLKKIKTEIDSLKKQRKYFQDHNENNKRKFVGVSHTAVKQKQTYANGMRRLGQKAISNGDKRVDQLIELLVQFKADGKRELIKDMAETIIEIGEQSTQIEAQEKQIIEKRADGRVSCGSCDQTFATTGDLSHHLTVTHKIHTSDRSKNKIEIITIE